MSALDSKIPPPIVTALGAVGMWAIARVSPALSLPDGARIAAVCMLAVAGLAVELAGALSLLRARTTVNPLDPCSASTLVVTGVYRYSRNPIYLGDLLLLLAWATFLSNPLTLVVVPLFVLYLDRFQIRPEERALRELFGDPYVEFQARVRRWL